MFATNTSAHLKTFLKLIAPRYGREAGPDRGLCANYRIPPFVTYRMTVIQHAQTAFMGRNIGAAACIAFIRIFGPHANT